jgi:hypothetical protein
MGAPAKLNGKAVEGVRIFLGGKVGAGRRAGWGRVRGAAGVLEPTRRGSGWSGSPACPGQSPHWSTSCP